jgi:Ca2+-binding EF-hand superfamily protein
LDYTEFLDGLVNVGIRLREEEVKRIFDVLDKDRSGSITYDEFCDMFEDKHKRIQLMANELTK